MKQLLNASFVYMLVGVASGLFIALGFIGALRVRRAAVSAPTNPSAQEKAHRS